METRLWKSLALTIGFAVAVTVTKAQFIKDVYRFYNTLSVSPPDCGPDLVPTATPGTCNPVYPTGGSFITDSLPYCGISRVVYHNNMHWGLKYPNTQGTITTTYTIHIYLKATAWSSALWARIIDFSNGISDNGIYFKKQTASQDRCIDFYPNGIVGTCPYFNTTTWYLLTFTRNGATGMMYVYVNNTLFASYNDAAGLYTSVPGKPVYIYRDDQAVPCESGEANFSYLSFTNQFSSQATVDSVYGDICSIANAPISANFSLSPNPACQSDNITVSYTGDIPSPGVGYTFTWNWNGGTVVSGSGMGPYIVHWDIPGPKSVTLTVTNNNCGSQNIDTAYINIGAPTTSLINHTICQGQTYSGYSATGIYVDTFVNSAGCDSLRTLNLNVNPASASTISQSICQGQTYLGHSTSGVYTDIFTGSNGCDSVRTLQLTVNPKTFSSINKSICEGQAFLGYTTTGVYQDTLVNSFGCDSIRTLTLTVLKSPVPDLGPDRSLCIGDSMTITPGSFLSYLWQDGSSLSYFTVRQQGQYSVTVSNNCGSGSDNVVITEQLCDPYFPSGFTPNRDGKNDLFKILNAVNLQDYQLAVYNRWGQKLFQTYNYRSGWDGNFNGQMQNSGAYVWICRFKRNNQEYNLKGTVLLIR
jgi:gliding motility-associated-like protein